jgi:hypothetical protein
MLPVRERSPCRNFTEGVTTMTGRIWLTCTIATLCALAFSLDAAARDVKPTDEGKGAAFKSKSFEMKEKGEAAVLLSFSADQEVTVTTKGDKETDVHLFVYGADGKVVGKDTSPGPKCEVKFKPAKDGKFKLLVRNVGPGANTVTLEVKVAK